MHCDNQNQCLKNPWLLSLFNKFHDYSKPGKKNKTKQNKHLPWLIQDFSMWREPCPSISIPNWFINDAGWHLTLISHLIGSHGSNWTSALQMKTINTLAYLTAWPHADGLWSWHVTFDIMNIWRFLCYIHNPSLVPIIFSSPNKTHFIFLLCIINWPQMTLTLVCDLWNHQQMKISILHLWPKFGWNPLQHVKKMAKC